MGAAIPVASRRFEDLLLESSARHRSGHGGASLDCPCSLPDFGKGSGHLAKLSFGDCFAYALAKATGEPRLFRGDDLTHTDLAAVLK
jgi:ribonuclease VapC